MYRLSDLLAEKTDPQPVLSIKSSGPVSHVLFNADSTLLCVSQGSGQAIQIYNITNQVNMFLHMVPVCIVYYVGEHCSSCFKSFLIYRNYYFCAHLHKLPRSYGPILPTQVLGVLLSNLNVYYFCALGSPKHI